jgi:polyisoprenoid-binding protein YceI
VVSASLLDAKAYPEISFDGTSVRQDGQGWLVSGSVTAHGTTVPAEFQITQIQGESGLVRFRAAARLDRTSFGVTKKKGMVGRTADVVVDAAARPA